MKIYLASSWRNENQPAVLAELRAAGHEVYDFKNPAPGNTGFGWRQTIDRPIKTPDDLLEALAHPRAVEGFTFDYDAMKWADACVLLLPCGNSAHLEAGWFAGRGRPVVVLVAELREPELMYKIFDELDGTTPIFTTTKDAIARLEEYLPEERGVTEGARAALAGSKRAPMATPNRRAPAAGEVLPPEQRASHWRKPIPGIDS